MDLFLEKVLVRPLLGPKDINFTIFFLLAVRSETELHHLTNSMSPSYKTTTTQKFSLTDPIVNVDRGTDPTEEWFNIHRKSSFVILARFPPSPN